MVMISEIMKVLAYCLVRFEAAWKNIQDAVWLFYDFWLSMRSVKQVIGE